MTTLSELKAQSRWLLAHAQDVTSQTGEDGILAKALSLLPNRSHWLVEFGAWDGKQFSNTYELMRADPRNRVVFFEPNPTKFSDLDRAYAFRDRATCINAFVGFDTATGLDALLSRTPIRVDFDLLSIDIDGNDYHVWMAVTHYRPRLVIIEFNPTMANSSRYIQPADRNCMHGSAPRAIVELAKAKGYELVCATSWNLLFVTVEDFPQFHIPDNSLELMRDEVYVPQVAVGFDGEVIAEHGGEPGLSLIWHQLRVPGSDLQILPSYLRTFPDNYRPAQRRLFDLWTLTRRVKRKLFGR